MNLRNFIIGLVCVAGLSVMITSAVDKNIYDHRVADYIKVHVEDVSKLHLVINKQREIIRRLDRLAVMVERPVRTRCAQKKGVRSSIITVPPQPDKFDVFETYIELKPKPHFAERLITMKRWNEIWKCNCPLTCDCWLGLQCEHRGCMSGVK